MPFSNDDGISVSDSPGNKSKARRRNHVARTPRRSRLLRRRPVWRTPSRPPYCWLRLEALSGHPTTVMSNYCTPDTCTCTCSLHGGSSQSARMLRWRYLYLYEAVPPESPTGALPTVCLCGAWLEFRWLRQGQNARWLCWQHACDANPNYSSSTMFLQATDRPNRTRIPPSATYEMNLACKKHRPNAGTYEANPHYRSCEVFLSRYHVTAAHRRSAVQPTCQTALVSCHQQHTE